MDLDLRLLSGFVAVAQEGNFSRAAEQLHLTQPALTRRVRRLEEIVGAPLLRRTTRQVALTPAGEALLEPARRALDAAHDALEAARRAAHGAGGGLRVGLSVSGNFDIAPAILTGFQALHPEVELLVTRAATAENVRALARREADIAFVRSPLPEDPSGIAHEVLFTEPLVAAVPEAHRLAARAAVPRDAAAREPLVITPRPLGPGAYDLITGYLWPGDPDPDRHIADHRPDEEMMVQAVAAGHGIAVLFKSRADTLSVPAVCYRPLDPPLLGELSLAWRADDPNPRLRAFRAAARHAVRSSRG
jgi:DNA-binding transcriptional LysR family regulator